MFKTEFSVDYDIGTREVVEEEILEKPDHLKPKPTGLPAHYAPYAYDYRLHKCSNYSECLEKVSTRKLPNGKYPETWACHNCPVPKFHGVEIGDLSRIRITRKCVDCDDEYEICIRNYNIQIRCTPCQRYENSKDDCACGSPKGKYAVSCYRCAEKRRVKKKCRKCGVVLLIHPNRRHNGLCDKCEAHAYYIRRKEAFDFRCKKCGALISERSETGQCRKCYDAARTKYTSEDYWCACGKRKAKKSDKCRACRNKENRFGLPPSLKMTCANCGRNFNIDYSFFSRIVRTGREPEDFCCSIKCVAAYYNTQVRDWYPAHIEIPCATAGCENLVKRPFNRLGKFFNEGKPVFCSKRCSNLYTKCRPEERESRLKENWLETARKIVKKERSLALKDRRERKKRYSRRGYLEAVKKIRETYGPYDPSKRFKGKPRGSRSKPRHREEALQ